MRVERHVRRAGVMSAGTLAVVLTGSAAPQPAAADTDGGECADGTNLVTTVTGVVCDTAGATSDTVGTTLDRTAGGATDGGTGETVGGVAGGVTDTVAGTVHDTAREVTGDDGAGTPDSDPDGEGGSGGGASGGDGDGRSANLSLGAAGSPAGARNDEPAATSTSSYDSGAASSPYLQPLSSMALLRANSLLGGEVAEPKLPEIAAEGEPSPAPTPAPTEYMIQAGEQQGDRGEATPALMALFALLTAGLVTGSHVALSKVRNRQVN